MASAEPTTAVSPKPAPPSDVPTPTQENLQEFLRQATIGEYEILGVLGRGGMATVFLAHDLSLNRKVAIKVLAPALFQIGEGMIERFKREARTAAALSHPHIIPIYAVKESHQILYFVMKYVAGRPLDAVIHDIGGLPIKMVQTILAQVGDALAYAHRHGVIHRDIKSANIMLDEEGWAVVTDFGIAKVEAAQGLTITGVTVGTPAYMSPEQCATEEVTGATDQYSLGVVAYEMLTGRLPFQASSSMSVMYAHFNERPQDVTRLRPDCPPNLASAVMRMLEKKPDARWPTLDDVVAVCGRPSLRRDDPVRSEMMTLAKAGPQAKLLAGLQVPTSPIALARSRSPAPSGRRRRASRAWLWVGGLVAAAIAAFVVASNALPWRLVRGDRSPGGTGGGLLTDSAALMPQQAGLVTDTATRPQQQQPAAPRSTRPVTASRRDSVASRAAVSAAVRQEDSVLHSLRATALAALRRAVEAGATPADLARGETLLRGADSLAAQNRSADAMVQFVTATSAWDDAERAARARVAAARDTVRPPVVAAPSAPSGPPAAPPASANPRAQIEASIAAYARALESRDIGQVRRAYPGLTARQQQVWEDFFKAVRNLKANLSVGNVDVKDNTAEAAVSGVYEFDNATTGRLERRPVTFRASLVSDAGAWRLSTIH
ncbi:MAG TPA: serine/threonine-protein kinase [Gemmatimonadales bacterium]|nr:serine/threonine-protein kinase [Gemmatimonadales bacterium]